jgi:hypothetical protein
MCSGSVSIVCQSSLRTLLDLKSNPRGLAVGMAHILSVLPVLVLVCQRLVSDYSFVPDIKLPLYVVRIYPRQACHTCVPGRRLPILHDRLLSTLCKKCRFSFNPFNKNKNSRVTTDISGIKTHRVLHIQKDNRKTPSTILKWQAWYSIDEEHITSGFHRKTKYY